MTVTYIMEFNYLLACSHPVDNLLVSGLFVVDILLLSVDNN